MVEIQNITFCAELNCELDLEFIARNSLNVEYKWKKINAVIKRLRNPRCTCKIFSNGNIGLTGCRSIEQCDIAIRKIARMVQKLGYQVKISNKRVTNMVGSFNFGSTIDLVELNTSIGQNASFEPELFPGLIFTDDRCKILVFRSGKIIITGVKCKKELNDAFEIIFIKLF
jgi:transcription initiation factor TFIID TATA-box-binding protein